MKASSLHRAAQRGHLEVQKGAFEACFAEGLDFSELDAYSPPSGRTASSSAAAAQLLHIKTEEKKRKAREEKEESRFQSAVQQRITQLKEASSKKEEEDALRAAPPCADAPRDGARDLMKGGIFSAVVGMHGSDKTEPKTKLKREKRPASKRLKAADPRSSSSAKGRVNKKSRRSKY